MVRPPAKTGYFYAALLLLLGLKMILQVHLFIGLTNAEYGEESIFYEHAMTHAESPSQYFEVMHRWEGVKDWSKYMADPAEMYFFRISALYPNCWFVHWFGVSEFVLCLFTMLSGVLAVGLVALSGRALGHPLAGLFAGFALAVTPTHILYSARIDTDMPQLFYLSLLTYLLIVYVNEEESHSTSTGRIVRGLVVGLSGGLVYLAKLPVGILAGAWAVVVPIFYNFPKKTGLGLRQAFFIASGCLLVFSAETVLYHYFFKQWFLHWHIMEGNATNLPAWKDSSVRWDAGPLTIYLYNTGWAGMLGYARMAAGYDYDLYQAPLLGFVPYAFVVALPIAFFRRSGISSGMRLSKLIVLGFVLYYFYLEFLCVFPEYKDHHLTLTYYHKNHRFFIPCLIGMCLTIGLAMERIQEYWDGRVGNLPRLFFWITAVLPNAALLLIISAGSVSTVKFWVARYRGSLSEMRAASKYILAHSANTKYVYVEEGTIGYFQVFLGDPKYEVHDLRAEMPLSSLCGGYAVVGGDHGLGTSQGPEITSYIHPDLVNYWRQKGEPPSGWEPVYTPPVDGEIGRMPLRLMKLPLCTKPKASRS